VKRDARLLVFRVTRVPLVALLAVVSLSLEVAIPRLAAVVPRVVLEVASPRPVVVPRLVEGGASRVECARKSAARGGGRLLSIVATLCSDPTKEGEGRETHRCPGDLVRKRLGNNRDNNVAFNDRRCHWISLYLAALLFTC
jgi:hypothetical protein